MGIVLDTVSYKELLEEIMMWLYEDANQRSQSKLCRTPENRSKPELKKRSACIQYMKTVHDKVTQGQNGLP